MAIEKLLARLTAQSSGPNPKEPGGGLPEFTAADISLIASHAPHMSFHALMAKCCDDPISINALGNWAYNESVNEWFNNPACQRIRFEARQLIRLSALSVASWLNPQLTQAATLRERATFIGANSQTYRDNFQSHFSYLQQEMDYLAEVGRRAIYKFKKDIEDAKSSV